MSVFSQPPRLFSNKENSTIPLTHHLSTTSSSASTTANSLLKPRVGGIGIAPKRRLHHQVNKPYNRVASVQRAKEKANKGPKRRPVPLSLQLSGTGTIQASPQSKYSGSKHHQQQQQDQQQQQQNRHSERSTPATSASRPETSGGGITIPLALPLIDIPPVRPVLTEDGEYIPADYTVAKLLPEMNRLYIASALYRPFTTSSSGETTFGTLEDGRVTLPFALPLGISDKARANCHDHEPDVCLYITRNGQGVGRAIPVNEMVYRSQCSYWKGTGDFEDEQETSSVSVNSDISTDTVSLSTIREEDDDGSESRSIDDNDPESRSTDDNDPEPRSTDDGDNSRSAKFRSSARFTDDKPNYRSAHNKVNSDSHSTHDRSDSTHDNSDSKYHLDLALIHLPLPSPETFNVIHHHLHFPLIPFYSNLLDLPPPSPSHSSPSPSHSSPTLYSSTSPDLRSTTTSPARPSTQTIRGSSTPTTTTTYQAKLRTLSQPELLLRLERIHGVWRNLCALGMGRKKTWTQVAEAWGWCIDALLFNGMRPGTSTTTTTTSFSTFRVE
ncbi:hypothetical protein BCR39DRAFT_590023 [Naematelia encephala]|uniref:Uncharacterized protein n=1 Tax=Naematelia encephala TaxID=71784 RepID=A0A1Y2AUY7_9TREE|nr:hypothetical protein BCR39DRAFT_590023 [Naematelia encephala]